MRKIGKYEIVRELGKGATSVVYEAVDPFQDRHVAIKVVLSEALGSKEHGKRYRKLFLTEASLAGKLVHPHIVAIYDAVADDEGSYIVMEYVAGTTLEKYARVDSLLPFQGANNYSMIYQIINIGVVPPSRFRPELPPQIDAIVMRALQKDTADRYHAWEEFTHDLVTAQGGPRQKSATGMPESEKFDTLRKLEFFRRFTDVELWEVLRLSVWHKHPRDTEMIREGDVGSSFFILAAGEVKVTKQERLLNVLKTGECFGEMAYLGKQRFQRSASVVSISDIVAVEIRAETLSQASELCRHHFQGAFLELLVDRLAMANLRLSQLLVDRNVSIF